MFNIPNAADASNVLQAQPDSRDFSAIIAAAFSGTGIVSGCAVTAQASPNMTVAVAAGSVAVAQTVVAVTGGNVTITAANASNPRFDLVCVDNTGAKSAVAGTPAAAPVFPDPAGKVVLAAVLVPASAASITNVMIVDKRLTAVVVPQQIPTGVINQFAGSAAPAGWLLCDGSAQSRSTYSTLYALLGNTYGAGDGSTTFNLPDLRGRVAVGLGTNADVTALGGSDGLAVGSRSPKHNSTSLLTVTGAPTVGSLTVTGAPSLGSLVVSGAPAIGSLAIIGAPAAGTLAVTGSPGVGSLALPNHTHTQQGERSATGGSADKIAIDTASISGANTGNPTTLPAINGTPSIGTLALGGAPAVGSLAVNGAPAVGSLGVSGAPGAGSLGVGGAPALGSLAVGGSIGVAGARPSDTPAYLVVNHIIKT